ncbi:hypothetical protein L8R80_18710 [Vibrio splendidus]|uniref:hypothetical protein n=1 Tax=Vibrio splendidus TaxID=29497 RepID=UPI0024695D91|nr:hypothetical protein [Vibrio splendidus]MDH5914445.1 hypothetical protein [Vibrio splendidus]MDH5943515.1 hypothetical protein [Vibrio splendidus]MDH5985151.1 hypothetical protein [Vibrio splendidus]MDH5995264.1 hypothetical protein [Vibrio splendidus]MDH6006744.1 hypothetical protein [Vibrio splendidus]
MKTKDQKIEDLETALVAAKLKIERLTEEQDYQPPIVSTLEVEPVELISFRQHCRAVEEEIESSNYLSSGVSDALSELRWMVINCHTISQSIDYEKQLMRTKAVNASDKYTGQLARDVAKKSVLGSKVATQLAVFNALFELDRIQVEMDITEFEEYLLNHDATSLLANSSGKLSDLVALRKARINGSFSQIEEIVDKILDNDDE